MSLLDAIRLEYIVSKATYNQGIVMGMPINDEEFENVLKVIHEYEKAIISPIETVIFIRHEMCFNLLRSIAQLHGKCAVRHSTLPHVKYRVSLYIKKLFIKIKFILGEHEE